MGSLLDKKLFDFVDGKEGNSRFTRLIKKSIQRIVVKKDFLKNLAASTYWTMAALLALCICSFGANFIPGRASTIARWVGGVAGVLLITISITGVYSYIQFKKFAKNGYGLNEGKDFHHWINNIISKHRVCGDPTKKHIKNLQDLKEHFERVPPNLKVDKDPRRDNRELPPSTPQMSIIASDITAERKIEFPRMWDLYWTDMKQIRPGDFVRASMSIPIFFQTYTLPVGGSLEKWQKHLDWQNKRVPNKAQFVDGGTLSNFPISVFANPNYPVPRMPTFGIRLMDQKPDQTKNVRSTFAGYAGSIIGTMRANYDREFTTKNRAFNLGVAVVQLKNHNWLNFFMDDKEKTEIFNCGVLAAQEFLKEFDWEAYKAARKKDADDLKTADNNPNNFHGPVPK